MKIKHILETVCARCKIIGIHIHWIWMGGELVRVCGACHTECHKKEKA
jgi:hypothetical protein